MTELETVRYTVNGGLARIQLNRPRYRNAQSAKLLEETDEAFNLAAGDPDVKVIILSGLGEAFSSGHDLGTAERQAELAQHTTDISEIENLFVYSCSHFLEMSLRWRDLPKPTIAQVHGWCIMGGWIVASAMDLIIAAEDARFVISHLQYSSLLFELGARKAKEIMFDPREISAREALDLGAINYVVPPDRLEKETTELGTRIARQSSFWLRMAKSSANAVEDASGFRTAMTASHANYMLSVFAELELERRAAGAPAPTIPVRRRLPIVDRALQSEPPEGSADH